MSSPFRHPGPASTPVAAFDFDGTLTCRDSFVAFLTWRAGGAGPLAAAVLGLMPAAGAYALTRDRGALKARIARRFLGGMTRAEISREAERFCRARIGRLLRPDAVRCWRDWQARGARLVIVTASPDILVAPFAKALGTDALIATRLAFDAADRFVGALDGPNCRGPEKVRRLRETLGPEVRLAAAYGDTAGDREMLAMAEAPGLRVFKERPL